MRADNLRLKVGSLIIFVVICLLLFIYLFTQAGGRVRLNEPYKLNAIVPDALNIVDNSDVRRDGVKIGRVKGIEPDGVNSKLTFEIEKKNQEPLFKDATVRVRTKTLVGESYLDVDPGHPATGKLADKATLPVTAAAEVVPLERILSTFDPQTRAEIRRNLKGIGVGLEGHGDDLNALFGTVNPFVQNGDRLGKVLLPQRKELAALIDNTGQVLQAFGERTAAFRALAVDSKATAEAVVARDDQLRSSLDEIPATLDKAKASVAKLATFSNTATPVMASLRRSSTQLSPAIQDLGPTAASTRTFFKELTPFLAKADPLLDELSPATKKIQTFIKPLDAVLRQADPALQYMKPYSTEFGTFFANVGSLVSGKDAYGDIGRVLGMLGPDQLTNLTPESAKIVHALLETASAGVLKNRRNPYPMPGTAGDPTAAENFTRVQQAGASGK